jgi:hypothetical protein
MRKNRPHPYNEAGRKLKAAVVSSLMRYKGVDSTLKKMPEEIESYWAGLAEALMRQLQEAVAASIFAEEIAKTNLEVPLNAEGKFTVN